MPAPPLAVLWIDPGLATGFAGLDHGQFWADEFDWNAACDKITGYANYYRSMLYIGWERFTIRPDTHKMSPQPEAYEFPGVIRYINHVYGCPLLSPAQPSERNVATPAMLKAIGWWTPGKDDAQSATQHLLACMIRSYCVPPDIQTLLEQARAGTE